VNLSRRKRKYATETKTIYSESFHIQSKSFLHLLIGPDLGTVGEGSAQRVQQGAVSFSGFVVGRSNVGDPRVFSRRGLVRSEQGGLTACGMVPIR